MRTPEPGLDAPKYTGYGWWQWRGGKYQFRDLPAEAQEIARGLGLVDEDDDPSDIAEQQAE